MKETGSPMHCGHANESIGEMLSGECHCSDQCYCKRSPDHQDGKGPCYDPNKYPGLNRTKVEAIIRHYDLRLDEVNEMILGLNNFHKVLLKKNRDFAAREVVSCISFLKNAVELSNREKCPDCQGSGVKDNHGHDIDCKHCDGRGWNKV